MSEKLKDALKSTILQAEAITNGGGQLTTEQMQQYSALVGQAESLKNQIDAENKMQGLKSWGEQSTGSAVKASFDRMALPDEGEIPGVSADPRSGEMYAIAGSYKGVGEKNLSHLKSAAYKDAFASFIRAKGLKNEDGAGRAMKVLNEGQWTAGEAWLPPDFRAELIKRMAASTSVRPNASVYTTGTNQVTFPQVHYTSDDLYTSGARFTWQGAGAQTGGVSEATNPVSGQINIPVHLATAQITLQRAQLEDNSFDILGYISEIGAEAFSLGEEDAFTNGTGNGQPQGFLKHPTVAIAQGATGVVAGVTYSGGWVSGTSDIIWGNPATPTGILGVEVSLPPQYEGGAKWYANKNTYSRIRGINAGTANLPQWSLGDSWPNFGNNYQPMLLGYATARNQFMPSITYGTAKNVLMLGDLKGYYIIDRVGLSVEVNPYIYQDRDQVMVYMRKRVGGQLVKYWGCKFLGTTT